VRETKSGRRESRDEIEHPMLALQHSIGNRAVAELARSMLLRQPDGQAAPQELHDVPIGQPPPAQVPATDLAAAGSPPPTVTYTGPPVATAAAPTTAPTTPAAPSTAQAPAPDPAQTAPQTPAPTGDTSTPHSDWTLTRDPFNVTLTYTIADLHLWRSRSRMLDVDFLADPSASISVGLDEPHAAAGGAAVNIFLVHIKQNGDSFLDLGVGPSVGLDGSGATVSGQGTAELHLNDTTSLTFTATFTPTPGPDGLGLQSTEVVGFMKHF
jgi:hypothetical protein